MYAEMDSHYSQMRTQSKLETSYDTNYALKYTKEVANEQKKKSFAHKPIRARASSAMERPTNNG